jgi:hypothetical protein
MTEIEEGVSRFQRGSGRRVVIYADDREWARVMIAKGLG